MRARVLIVIAVGRFLAAGTPNAHADAARAAAHVESAFAAGQADRLLPVLSDQHKVHLKLPQVHRETGYFGADQLVYIFGEIFSEHTTQDVELDLRESDDDTVHASLVWRCRDADSEDHVVKMMLTLELSGDRYVLTRVTSTGR